MKKKILELRKEGKTYNQIKEILGCSKSTISYHCGKRLNKQRLSTIICKNDVLNVVKKCISYRSLLEELKLEQTPSNQRSIKRICEKYEIDTSHFLGQGWKKGHSVKNVTKEDYITKRLRLKTYKSNSHNMKLQLYDYGIKERKCEECGIKEEWNGKYLSLHLDHINGNRYDDRLENLRILCPNCHSQTETYSGKKNKL